MFRHEVTIEPAEVPVIQTYEDMTRAAADLTMRNCAYVVPDVIETSFGPLTDPERKMHALQYALDRERPKWQSVSGTSRLVAAPDDRGMHGNPFDSLYQSTPDYLHYHQTPQGAVVVTFAEPGPDYHEDRRAANNRLTELLREGKTDPRLALPDSFQQVEIKGGEAVVFRLNNAEGVPYLHDFQTVGDERVVDIAAISRIDAARPTEQLLGVIDFIFGRVLPGSPFGRRHQF